MSSPGNTTAATETGEGFFARLWRRLTTVRSTQEDEAHREYMIKVVLVFNSLVSLPFTLLASIGCTLGLIPWDTVLVLVIVSAAFLTGWWRADRGHLWFGGAISSLVLFAAGFYGSYVGGIDAPAMLLYALAIVLAAILLDTWAQMALLALSLVSYLGLGLAHNYGYLISVRSAGNMFVNRVSIVLAALTTISLGVWFLKGQYQRSIKQVRSQAKTTRTVFETITDGIVFTDLSGKMLDVNETLIHMLGFERKEKVLGRPFIEFLIPEERANAWQFYQSLLSGTPNSTLSCRGQLPDGGEIFLEINAAVYLDSKNRPGGYVSAVRDVTQRKQAEDELNRYREHLEELVALRTEKLDEAYRELESFSYSVSHDLRSPLRRIEGFSKILAEEFSAQLPEQGLNHLQRIIYSTHHMMELINDLLNFSRLIRQPVSRQQLLPHLIARAVADELLGGEYCKYPIAIDINDMPPCEADPTLLYQVYFNLLDNAFKYSRNQAQPRVEVGAQQKDSQTIYYVSDNGVGFDTQYASRIFGVFQRLHSDKEYEGTGIGLATVQRIINRHHGKIWVESAVNQGARFYFTLPPYDHNHE